MQLMNSGTAAAAKAAAGMTSTDEKRNNQMLSQFSQFSQSGAGGRAAGRETYGSLMNGVPDHPDYYFQQKQ